MFNEGLPVIIGLGLAALYFIFEGVKNIRLRLLQNQEDLGISVHDQVEQILHHSY